MILYWNGDSKLCVGPESLTANKPIEKPFGVRSPATWPTIEWVPTINRGTIPQLRQVATKRHPPIAEGGLIGLYKRKALTKTIDRCARCTSANCAQSEQH